MLELVWEPLVVEQLAGIIDYIAQYNFAAAERLERQIHAKVELACHVPGMGRPGRVGNTRADFDLAEPMGDSQAG